MARTDDRSDRRGPDPEQNGLPVATRRAPTASASRRRRRGYPDADPDLVAQNEALQPWFEDQIGSDATFELLASEATSTSASCRMQELAGRQRAGYHAARRPPTAQRGSPSWSRSPTSDPTQNPCPFSDPGLGGARQHRHPGLHPVEHSTRRHWPAPIRPGPVQPAGDRAGRSTVALLELGLPVGRAC
ncbi:MAG: hypothetical protein U5R48_11940 [Gammaproteobacteria bacterium]|nr:hypothetical protein [Gammaproteobacteria bacterium]